MNSREAEQSSWTGHPAAALLLRGAIFIAPVVAGVGVSSTIATRLPSPDSLGRWIAWFCLLAFISTIVMIAVERGARRLLPLAALLKLSLIFPDEAPSRFNTALRSGNTRQIGRQVAAARAEGLTGTATEAAHSLLMMMSALSEHDRATRGHGERVRAYAALIGEEMGLSEIELSKLQWAALAHDVGKLVIPTEILNKPGRLTDEEFELIKTHPEAGTRLIEPMREWLGEWGDAVGQHHERIDGQGYPLGLKGDEISLGARIVAVADVFDVITAARSYKKAQSAVEARKELQRCAGTQFDPDVVRAFLNVSLGRQRRTMWPLSWIAHVPVLGGIATAPVATVVAPAALAVASVGGGMAVAEPGVFDMPMAIAFHDDSDDRTSLFESKGAIDVVLPAHDDDEVAVGLRPDPSDDVETEETSDVAGGWPQGTPTTAGSDELNAGQPPSPGVSSTSTTTPKPSTAPSTAPPTTAPTTTVPTTKAPTTTTTAPTTTTTAPTTTTTKAPTTTTTTPAQACAAAQSGATALRNANLVGCDLSGRTLTNVDMRGADLSNADLSNSTISQSDFDGATLTGANFRGASVGATTFRAVAADGVNLRQAWFEDVSFRGATLTGADGRQAVFVEADLSAVDATDANFKQAWLAEAIIESSTFDATDMSSANLTEASLIGTTFAEANVFKSGLGNASLHDSDFTGSTGVPSNHTSAEYKNTTCPAGNVSSVGCW